MNASNRRPLGDGSILDERYKVGAALSRESGTDVYQGEDQTNGRRVVLSSVTEEEATLLRPMLQAEHPQLRVPSALLDLKEGPVVVSPFTEGETLGERVDREGKLEVGGAVRVALQVADALSVIHRAGGAHGRVHPGAIIFDGDDDKQFHLTFAGSPGRNYRKASDPLATPTAADDTFAVCMLLVYMLTGKEPPSGGVATEVQLKALGVRDERLLQTLKRELIPTDEGSKTAGIANLKRDLTRWFVESRSDEPLASSPISSIPPPLPSKPTAHSTQPAPQPRSSNGRLGLLAAGGLVVGLVVAWAASSLMGKAEVVATAPSASAPAAQASAGVPEPIDLGEVAVSGEREGQAVAEDKLSACIMSYLPENSFGKAPELGFVCEETDPRKGASALRAELVKHAPKGPPSEAMQSFAVMGRYDQAAFSIARSGCCPEAAALSVGDPSEGCDNFAQRITAIGKAVVDGEDVSKAVDDFVATADCEIKAGKIVGLRAAAKPGDREAFQKYVEKLKSR